MARSAQQRAGVIPPRHDLHGRGDARDGHRGVERVHEAAVAELTEDAESPAPHRAVGHQGALVGGAGFHGGGPARDERPSGLAPVGAQHRARRVHDAELGVALDRTERDLTGVDELR